MGRPSIKVIANSDGYKIKIPTVKEVSASPERSASVTATARLGGNCWGGV